MNKGEFYMKNIVRVFQIIAILLMIIFYVIDYNRSGVMAMIPFLTISILTNEASEY
jgi:hypothetical protein